MFRRKRPVRLIVAVPPRHFFGGNDRANAEELLDSLREIYPSIFIFDTTTLFSNDRPRIERLVEAAQDFRADIGIALPNASYAMMLKPLPPPDPPPQKTWLQRIKDRLTPQPPNNIFADILGVPTVLLWDHVITQPAYLILGDLPLSRRDGQPGAITKLRKALNNERFQHYIPDSGHIEAVAELGLLTSEHVRPYVVPAHTSFLEQPSDEVSPQRDRILFAGNLYSSATKTFASDDWPLVEDIARSMTDGKIKDWSLSGWALFRSAAQDRELTVPELSPDNSFYWSLANRLMGGHLSTAFREEVLTNCPHPIDYYGGFADPAHTKVYSENRKIVHRGSVPLSDLRHLYRRYTLSIDVTHSPFIRGSNAKVLDCFASGGCMMVDWRADLANAVGDVANHFMYRDREDLAARCDTLLSNENLRLEVMQEMRQIIREKLTFNRLLTSIVEQTLTR